MFIVLMIRSKRFDDLLVVQQFDRGAGIFRQNQVSFFKNLQRPEADVLEITYGGRDEVKHWEECANVEMC